MVERGRLEPLVQESVQKSLIENVVDSSSVDGLREEHSDGVPRKCVGIHMGLDTTSGDSVYPVIDGVDGISLVGVVEFVVTLLLVDGISLM